MPVIFQVSSSPPCCSMQHALLLITLFFFLCFLRILITTIHSALRFKVVVRWISINSKLVWIKLIGIDVDSRELSTAIYSYFLGVCRTLLYVWSSDVKSSPWSDKELTAISTCKAKLWIGLKTEAWSSGLISWVLVGF